VCFLFLKHKNLFFVGVEPPFLFRSMFLTFETRKPLFLSEAFNNLNHFSFKGVFLILETRKPPFSSEVEPLFFLGGVSHFFKHRSLFFHRRLLII
jgi:hypothetical protein